VVNAAKKPVPKTKNGAGGQKELLMPIAACDHSDVEKSLWMPANYLAERPSA
jgi:hypothetical protein